VQIAKQKLSFRVLVESWCSGDKGGQKTMKPDPPDQSYRTVRPSVSIYTDEYEYGYFKFLDNRRITDFEILVGQYLLK
jgi:hypothetical protein